MRSIYSFNISDIDLLRLNLVNWAKQFDYFVLLDSNSDRIEKEIQSKYSEFDILVGAGHLSIANIELNAFKNIYDFTNSNSDWCFGHLSYDLKNVIHNTTSVNVDYIGFQEYFVFQPKWVIAVNNKKCTIQYPVNISEKEVSEVENIILQNQEFDNQNYNINEVFKCIDKSTYIRSVEQLKKHIHRGDIYEINYCINFILQQARIDPYKTFIKLGNYSPAPFSVFYKNKDRYLISSSPERFLKKTGNKIVTQPIKGTIRRGKTVEEDHLMKLNLIDNAKERAENTMITDLVRNDLSVTALPGSVIVEELCGLYSFKHVHQLISTVSSNLDRNQTWMDAIKFAFPMGSMTGAPKLNALKLAEKYENFRRGLYSGSVGYISPEMDFDFNVVIRSILYNADTGNLTIPAGSAITAESDPEKEYEECLLKVRALMDVISQK
jgi:para-aminobenzoate synthetase component 1